ncbi:MAG: sensor histidine kinase [Deltaproteobacteria bacterium]
MSKEDHRTIVIDSAANVVAARRLARRYARNAGLKLLDQTRFATAVSEIARNALLYASNGRLELQHAAEGRPAVVACIEDDGPGIDDLDAALAGDATSERGLGRGLAGTRALVDEMSVQTAPTGTRIELKKYVDKAPVTTPAHASVPSTATEPVSETSDLLEDMREQNDALLHTVEGLVHAEQALAQSEKKLALAVELAGLGTFVWREDGSVECDALALQLFGAEAIDNLDALTQRVLPSDRDGVRRQLTDVLETMGDTSIELRTVQNRWLSARLYAGRHDNPDGAGIGVVADVTMRRREAERAKEQIFFQQQLIGIVSHDLRSPLQVVTTAAQLLPEFGELNPQQLKTTDRIRSSVDRAGRLVQDLLDFARSSLGGRLPVTPTALDLGTLVRHIANQTKSLFDEHELVVETSGDLAGRWDADRLSQVMTNLLHNAFAYSPPGSTVTIAADGDGDRVTLSVHNAGEPVPEEVLPTLFEPLESRKRASSKKAAKSLGLGLYIVRAVAIAHGGTAWATSSEQEGTKILVELPRITHVPPSDEEKE